MIIFLSILYLNLSAPIMLYCLYRALLTKKMSFRKTLLLMASLSIALGNILVYLLLTRS